MKIKNVDIQKISCGFEELTKKKVIGQANIKIKKIFFFYKKKELKLKVK